ncbi:MAG: hypothetical protein GX803_06785 [Lentisphaerae bacterium]|jgi:hypothetical protein|nr:hypothetical protein [Lentisphaerota bacterium]
MDANGHKLFLGGGSGAAGGVGAKDFFAQKQIETDAKPGKTGQKRAKKEQKWVKTNDFGNKTWENCNFLKLCGEIWADWVTNLDEWAAAHKT